MRPLRHIVILAAALASSSCVDDVSPAVETTTQVTVNCILSCNDDIQTVYLHYTASIGAIFYEPVTEATVVIHDGDGNAVRFDKAGDGVWNSDFTPTPGTGYTITVTVPGEAPVTATTVAPVPAGIEGTDIQGTYIQDNNQSTYWAFILDGSDNPVRLSSTGHPDADHFNMDADHPTDNLYYIRIPFVQHPEPLTFKINGQPSGGRTVFRAVSDDYDRYLKSSFQKALAYSGTDDISSRFEENTVYSNIHGGVGIFGAYADTEFRAQP